MNPLTLNLIQLNPLTPATICQKPFTESHSPRGDAKLNPELWFCLTDWKNLIQFSPYLFWVKNTPNPNFAGNRNKNNKTNIETQRGSPSSWEWCSPFIKVNYRYIFSLIQPPQRKNILNKKKKRKEKKTGRGKIWTTHLDWF